MIIFHGGLPRSGKSYSACRDYIIPALQNNRRVFACIAGLDHAKFAELLHMSVDEVRRLLVQLTPDDVKPGNLGKLWDKYATDRKITDDYGKERNASLLQDSLLVIDEVQNLFPSKRQALVDSDMAFIAEHGHFGMDIVLMSQDWKDMHTAWRRRVQRKVLFVKMTAVGMEKRYKWEAWEGQGGEQFQKISSGTAAYDPQYFGLYRSHVEGTGNKGNLADDRINIFKGKGFRLGVPGMLFVSIFAGSFLWKFFHDPGAVSKAPPVAKREPSSQPARVDPAPVAQAAPVAPSRPAAPEPYKPVDYFDEMAQTCKLRLAGLIKTPERHYAIIKVYDKTFHAVEKFRTDELKAMGWDVEFKPYGVDVYRGNVRHVVRSWPINPFGAVTRDQVDALR